MKRIALFAVLAVVIASIASAGGRYDFNTGEWLLNPEAPNVQNNLQEKIETPPSLSQDAAESHKAGDRRSRMNVERVTVTGELTLVRGSIAVKSGDVTYLTVGLSRYINFIDSLKDGAAVTINGSAFSVPRSQNTKFLYVSKLTVGGKDYDLGMFQMPLLNRPETPERLIQPPGQIFGPGRIIRPSQTVRPGQLKRPESLRAPARPGRSGSSDRNR